MMFFTIALFLIQSFIKADEFNSGKDLIFYDCNNNPKHDQFDLTIPKFCNIEESNVWHMELKKVYHYHGNNQSCTSSLEILMVSKNFTMLLTSNLNRAENVLLMDYIESADYNVPGCIPKGKKYFHFNYNIFVDVERNFEWKNINVSKERLIEKSFTEIISLHHSNEINKNILLLGMESFLLIKSQTTKNILDNNFFTTESPGKLLKFIKKLFIADIETKYELNFSNIANIFKEVTGITLSNELAENKENYNKAAGKIKSRIDELGEMLYKETCRTRNEKIKHFNDKGTSDEKVRQFLGREGIKAQEFEQNRKYIISQCEEVIPKMVYEKRSIDNICYKLKPVIVGRSTLMFADEKNYLHHFSESRTCHSLIDFDHVLETFDHIRMGFIETCFNSIFGGINSTFKGLSMGWISHYFFKYQIYVSVCSLIIIAAAITYVYILLKEWKVIELFEKFFEVVWNFLKGIWAIISQIGKIFSTISKIHDKIQKKKANKKKITNNVEDIETGASV